MSWIPRCCDAHSKGLTRYYLATPTIGIPQFSRAPV
jgi:hypothetical protein